MEPVQMCGEGTLKPTQKWRDWQARQSPYQKTRASAPLSKNLQANPLMQTCDDGMVRRFWLPAKNIAWVEVGLKAPKLIACISWALSLENKKAMARYYHQSQPEHNDLSMD